MAKITKTKSGKYRTLVFYIDENGKRCRKSFTHEDKNTVKFLAADFLANQKDAHKENRMTVGEALKRYTDSKENVLSPSTIRSYRTICRNSLTELQKVRLCDLTNEVIQRAINVETAKHKPKTVSNIYGLLTAALGMFLPEFRPAATLPQKKRYEAVVPVDRQIKELLALAAGTDVEIPIILAAMGSLREGEIAPLLVEDILDSGVRVNKSMVRNQNEQWEIKPVPKTQAGERVAPLPKEVIAKIREAVKDKEPGDRLCDMTPAMIYKHYANLRGQCGMERCRFHDLRHYYASMAHLLGVPDQYIMLYGGWSDKSTLTKIYQQAQADYTDTESQKVTDFFGRMLGEVQPKN